MALDTNFNVNPYYDDYDEDKKYLRMLFKPGYAVQARELTQLQTILQKQVDRFGQHIFANGSRVLGCESVVQNLNYINLSSTYASTDVDANSFVGQTIYSTDETKRAEVLKVYEANAGASEPITLMIKQLYGDAFTSSETIKTGNATVAYANTTGTGEGRTYSVNEGVFFYDGFFIKNSPQTIAVSKYTTNSINVKIGFEITESIVTTSDDSTLLDPALDASNYQAPGSDRYKVDLILATRTLDSTDLEKFIEIARIEDSILEKDTRITVYSELAEEFARRTYDESGNYTVDPFKISLDTNSSNTAQTNITLSPGKAYVFGYEFVRNSPTKIIVPKPREVQNVTNKSISTDFGYFVYTKDQYGSFPINSLQTIDVHCVPNSSINLTSSAARTNTKIGTVRVKAMDYESSSNTSNSKTYVYRTYLFDVNINNSITGNVNTATTSSVTIGNVVAGHIFTNVTDAYKGAKLRITTGPGSNESPKTITGFTTATQNVTFTPSFVTTPTSASKFSIDFEFNDAESFHVSSSGTNVVASANIDDRSKDMASTYEDVVISDSRMEPLLFRIGDSYVANNTVANAQDLALSGFSYKRYYTGITFVGNDTPTLATGTGESFSAASTTNAKLEEYRVIVTSVGTSPYAVGETISADKITVDDVTPKITVTNANNMTANIVATIDVASPGAKVKTLITANSTIQTSGGQDIFANAAVLVYSSNGQTTIANTFVVKTPDVVQSLYVSDVYELIQVLDFNGAAVANTGYTDITERYTLDSGQRDSYYDHAAIKLKSGYLAPTGPLVVRYKKFSSSGPGYFSVDSYPSYEDIPTYTSPVTGAQYSLRDTLDFRPVRKDATSTLGGSVEFDVDPTITGPKIPKNNDDLILDYSNFMPRIDKVVLNKNKTFEVVQGVSSLRPVSPADKDNTMNLYVLNYPPYVANTRDIQIEYVNNKRFTMRDIGKLEKRIENLEYYTSLSLLEQDTLNKQDLTILDSTNLPRFKNGIVTDGFKGHSVADVSREEYIASIDITNKHLRPSFNIESYTLSFDAANSTNYLQSGPFITATGTSTAFIDQSLASRAINVNLFNVVDYLGTINLNPPSDIWIDTQTRPDVLINLGGDQDAWNQVMARTGASNWQFEWGDWNTRWTGNQRVINIGGTNQSWTVDWSPERWGTTVLTSTQEQALLTDIGQTRTGIASRVVTERITQSIGDRIIDVSVVPFMRRINITYVAHGFKPSTTLYSFFDNTSIENYVARANKFIMTTNNISLNTTIGNFETVAIKNTVSAATISTGRAVLASNNIIYLTNLSVSSTLNIATANIIGDVTGNSYKISSYEHYSGNPTGTGANTITLALGADGASNSGDYVGQTIFIVAGTGAGQSRTISGYVSGTRIATVSSNWSPALDTTSAYSIGRPKTDESGKVAGVFTIPSGTFRVGEKNFRFTDTSTGDIPSSTTSGDAAFFAQGLLQQKEQVLVSTIAPRVDRVAANDSRVITETTARWTQVVDQQFFPPAPAGDSGGDPLAQTFFVSSTNYPEGVFIDKVRFCFKTKDDRLPITLQIRPVQNGYPSAGMIYPYGEVSLTPDKVKITESPSLDDSTKYTEFVFDTPIYLQPGEHSFVLITNSNKYEAFVGEVGKLDLVGGKQISEQPYSGSLFISQNASTWTPDQNMDIMFRMFRKVFSDTPAVAKFNVAYPNSNTPIDLIHLITSQMSVGNTSIVYSFNSQKSDGNYTGDKVIIPLTDYDMDDGDGRRTLYQNVGNNTFILTSTMYTNNPDVSPVLDITRFGFIGVENIINNLPLANSGFTITSGGTGYSTNANAVVTITGGGGSGATAAATLTNNVVTSIYLTSVGSGYTSSPTITITDANTTPGTGATVTYNGEDQRSGGNALVRYMTRKVTLADGFDSGDLRVYLTAYKPAGTEIYVYAKFLSQSDPNVFDNSKYQLLTKISSNYTSVNKGDFREVVYAPGSNGIQDDSISYTDGTTSYRTFRTFAIKIVMSGSNTVDVPKVRDLRVVALPEGS